MMSTEHVRGHWRRDQRGRPRPVTSYQRQRTEDEEFERYRESEMARIAAESRRQQELEQTVRNDSVLMMEFAAKWAHVVAEIREAERDDNAEAVSELKSIADAYENAMRELSENINNAQNQMS